MMENKNILYGIIGLLAGLLIMGAFTSFGSHRNWNERSQNSMMHQMPDGSMMTNTGMDMDSMMKEMSASLEGKSGDTFDKAFLSEMIVHHEGAVVMAKQVLATSKRPELIKLANDIISAQTKEIEMMKSWQSAWFK